MKLYALILVLTTLPLFGQSVDTVAGGNQSLDMVGIQSKFQFRGRYGWSGLGYENGFVMGAYFNTPLNIFKPDSNPRKDKYRLGFGDQYLDASLAVDEFEGRAFTGRGGGLLIHTKTSDVQVFTGLFSQDSYQPFLHISQQFGGTPVGAIIWSQHLSDRLDTQSLNVVSDSITSIQSLLWRPSKRYSLSVAGGVGSNEPYFASAAECVKGRFETRLSFTQASTTFHRQDGYNFDVEPLGVNFKLKTPVGENSLLYLNHEHEMISVPKDLGLKQTSAVSTINSVDFTSSIMKTRVNFNAGQYGSDQYAGHVYTGVAAISRPILPRWTMAGAYVRSQSTVLSQNAYEFSNTYRMNNHLNVKQNFSRVGGKDNWTFGGEWSSNAISFTIDNQLYTSAIANQFGQAPVFQAWTFAIRVRTPAGTTSRMSATVDPFGKLRVGGYMTGMGYRAANNTHSTSDSIPQFTKYVICGEVVDEQGKGVSGIAIQIGAEVVYSDVEGVFFTHVKNTKPVPFAVAADTSIQTSRWTLASAPTSAHGALEATAEPIRVVVQMTNHNREIAQAGGN